MYNSTGTPIKRTAAIAVSVFDIFLSDAATVTVSASAVRSTFSTTGIGCVAGTTSGCVGVV